MSLGDNINKIRTQAKLTQAQFSEILGVSQQSVQKWENGDSVPELQKIINISKHFGISLDALILGNDNRIVEELHGERIDIVKYSEDPAEYVRAALSPANVISVEIADGERAARVIVAPDQLSLAIGKEGQNARLAARLTGYKIDIKTN